MFAIKHSTRTQVTNVYPPLCNFGSAISFEVLIRLRYFLQENDRNLKLYRLKHHVVERRRRIIAESITGTRVTVPVHDICVYPDERIIFLRISISRQTTNCLQIFTFGTASFEILKKKGTLLCHD